MKAHQLRGHSALDSSQGRPAVTRKQGKSTQQNRFLCHPICYAEQLPDWGTAEVIIFFSIGKEGAHRPPTRRPHGTMMMKSRVTKRLNFPSLHARGHDCDPVNSAC